MRCTSSLGVGLLGGLLSIAACGSPPEVQAPAAAPPAAAPGEAAAEAPAAGDAPAGPAGAAAEARTATGITVPIEARSGSTLAGTATLTEEAGGVRVRLEISGVSPGKHGAHVHEKGDCSAPDGASAGGHYNPGGHPHSLPKGSPRHLGDLGNVEIGPDGKGVLDLLAEGATLTGEASPSFLGRSIIVHEKEDDGGQPTGNAGGRIGCAVIKR